ncbi:hypothetical protein Hdeb2414_s0007g00225281 [Helianthus debilis subsp. tardiflorus]
MSVKLWTPATREGWDDFYRDARLGLLTGNLFKSARLGFEITTFHNSLFSRLIDWSIILSSLKLFMHF